MSTPAQFGSHVAVEDIENCALHCSPFWDTLLGGVLVLCTLVGAPANVLSLRYFWTTMRLGDLTAKLYFSICCIDICTTLIHLPVTVALFNARYPVLFNHLIFCG